MMTYSEEIADRICDVLAASDRGLQAICAAADMPSVRTVYRWLEKNEAFRLKYFLAREAQADFLADQIIEIADDATNDYMTITKGDETYNVVNREVLSRSKLRVDARKWKASKLAPKKYGDKVDLTSGGEKLEVTVIRWGDKNIAV